MAKPLDQLRKIRLEKLEEIKKLGVDPYPAHCQCKQTVAQALNLMGKKVAVAGRIMAIRGHGGIQFFDLRDESGKIQLVFRKNQLSISPLRGIPSECNYQLSILLDIGDFLAAQGKVFRTKAGEVSVLVEDFQLLAKALRPLPSKWHGLKDVEERYRKRYLDLIMNPEVKKIFYLRSKVLTAIREFLGSEGFLEVETPILQEMYGGASARPFITHHNVLDCDLYLRISDELYLKRLIVGGFEKVYEVSKDFRNEGIDRAHNPEFTQVEFYWAYASYEDLMKLTEKMLVKVFKTTLGKTKVNFEDKVLDFTPPLPRVYFRDILFKETGIDVDEIKTESELLKVIKKRKIAIDLKGVFGLGSIFDKLYKEKVRPKLIQPTFLLDYPASMIALAKRKENEPNKIATMQLLVNGYELIKAYNELNDPLDQRARWLETEKLAKKGAEEVERLDEDYIHALEYGMPPTAGWGIGVDRFISLLVGKHSLKEVILFPTLRPEKPSFAKATEVKK